MISYKSEHVTSNDGARVEVSTVSHNGRDFTNLGSVVDHSHGYVVGYVKGSILTTWDGQVIGTVCEVSKWRTPRSFISSHMHSYRAVIDGKRYFGRGCGEGMSLKLKACKSHNVKAKPPCLTEMGCLCAAHARGAAANTQCDATE